MADATPAPTKVTEPASPPPKRTKYTEPAPSLAVASMLNDKQPTPTPETQASSQTHNMSQQLPSMHVPQEASPNDQAAHYMIQQLSQACAQQQVLIQQLQQQVAQLHIQQPLHVELPVQLLSPTARAPTHGSEHAAGMDLYASKAATIPARGQYLVDTDIAVAIPVGMYGRVAPRSGLAVKHSIDTGAGVIDSDYRGHVKVLLFNFGEKDFQVEVGERIAQMVLERIAVPHAVEVSQLPATVRGAGGFGSTGGFAGVVGGAAAVAPSDGKSA